MRVMIWDSKVSKEEWRAWRARKQAKNLYSATRVLFFLTRCTSFVSTRQLNEEPNQTNPANL
jgi:hypothetical protein